MLIPKTHEVSLWEADREFLRNELREFEALYARRPFDNFQGLQGPGAFTLFYYLRKLRPQVVIESGVWRGFSTWLIEMAAPQAKLFCCDPIFALAQFLRPDIAEGRYVSRRAIRTHQDFSCAEIALDGVPREGVVAFFDDHQNKVPRLLQARAKNIAHVIFDDNQPWHHTHVSLEELRNEPEFAVMFPKIADRYEIMPPLWDVTLAAHGARRIPGLNIGEERDFPGAYAHRDCYGFMTYVGIRA